MNTQPIEKLVPAQPSTLHQTLQVHSIFETIQGEGPFCGTPCVFIRLAGCNLQCPQCDTDYTSTRTDIYPGQIADAVTLMRPRGGLVVITGGEPFRQPAIEQLAWELLERSFYVQIETNGTLAPPVLPYSKDIVNRFGVYIVCAPKTGKINQLIEMSACAFKYVISHDSVNDGDGLPLKVLGHSAYPFVYRAQDPKHHKQTIYVQPAETGDKEIDKKNLDATVESCMRHGYVLQLQVHKILGME